MTLHVDFAPQTEAWINAEAEQKGVRPADVVRQLVEERVTSSADPAALAPEVTGQTDVTITSLYGGPYLLPSEIAKLPAAERDRLFSRAASFAATYYATDPELTIFNVLDSEPFLGEDE